MNNWELGLYLLVLLLGLAPLSRYAGQQGGRAWIPVAAIVLGCLVMAVFFAPVLDHSKPIVLGQEGFNVDSYLPRIVKEDGFVSSDQCKSCHPGEHASWHDTYHRTMTQAATPTSVLAPFDEVALEARGVQCRLEKRGDEFWAEMPDIEVQKAMQAQGLDLADSAVLSQVPTVRRRIVMTTGSHHFQGYWVAGTQGLDLLQFPFIYNIRKQRWMPAEDAFIRAPDGPRRFAIWNANCIQCHSVNAKPALNADGFFSRTAELGISCEACHGPGADHVRKYQNPLVRYQQRSRDETDETIVNPAKCSPSVSSQICGQCHSAFITKDADDWAANGLGFQAGDSLEEKRHLFYFNSVHARAINAEIAATAYWQDGTARTGGREYMAMIESPCFKHDDVNRQISCLSCHSMHDSDPNDQLARKMSGNEGCLQCHEEYRDKLEAHTHHEPESAGSQCYNCHMPHTTYGLLKAIRSHRVETPSVTVSVETGKPNGCNQCHLDKTLAWTATHLKSWYDVESAALSDDEQKMAASILWILKGDAAQRAMVTWMYGWEPAREASGDDWMAPFLAQLLDDPYSAVRYIAFETLSRVDGFSDLSYDYVGPREERFQIVAEVFRRWEQQGRSKQNAVPAVLMNSDGSLQRDEFRRLLKGRDNRPVEFPE